MPYRTTRSRIVTFSGTTSGRLYTRLFQPPFGIPVLETNSARFGISCSGLVISFFDAWSPIGNLRTWNANIRLTIGGADSGLITGQITEGFSLGTIPETWDIDLAGTWSISYNVIDVRDYQELGSFPSYGGASTPDTPANTKMLGTEVILAGTTITATATIGGLTVSASVTTVSDVVLGYNGSASCECSGQQEQVQSIGANISGFAGSAGITYLTSADIMPDVSISQSDANHSLVIDNISYGGAMRAVVTCGAGGWRTNATVGGCSLKRYNLSGVLRAMENAYPASVDLRVDRFLGGENTLLPASSGVFSDSYSQRFYSVGGSFSSYSAGSGWTAISGKLWSDAKNEWKPLRLWVDAGSLSTLKEDSRLWRMFFRCDFWNALTITQASEITICGTGTFTTGSNSKTIPDGSTSAGAKGTKSGVWDGKTSFQFGRYLYLPLKHDNAGSQTLTNIVIGGKTFTKDKNGNALTIPTGASYSTVILDLCAPSTPNSATDAMDTRFPLPTADNSAWGWGITSANSIVLNGIGAGVTWTLQDSKIKREAFSKFSLLQSFDNWIFDGDTPGSDYLLDFALGDTDGRKSLEGVAMYRTAIPAGGYNYTERSIKDLVDSINGSAGVFPSDGFTAVDLQSLPGSGCSGSFANLKYCFANSVRRAVYLAGGGAYHDATGWHYPIDLDITSTTTIPAQFLTDEIEWYPGFGDGFGFSSGGYGVAEFRSAWLAREQIAGIVEKNFAGISGVLVDSLDVGDGANTGQGTSDSRGNYQTASNYAKGLRSLCVSAQQGAQPYPKITQTGISRKRKRNCFRITDISVLGNPFILEDSWGELHCVGVKDDKIIYSRSDHSLPLPEWKIAELQITAPISGKLDSRPVICRNSQRRMILLFQRKDGSQYDIFESYSDDDGESWSTAVITIPNGQKPIIACSVDGAIFRAAYIPSTEKISANFQEPGDTVPSANFNLKDGTGADLLFENDTFMAMPAYDSSARWVMCCLIKGESSVSTWFSVDSCRTWKRI